MLLNINAKGLAWTLYLLKGTDVMELLIYNIYNVALF